MNKKIITQVILALLVTMSTQADVIPSKYYSTAATGEYYLYDVTAEQFLKTSDRTFSASPAELESLTESDSKFLISGASGKYLKLGDWKGQFLWSDGDATSTKWSMEASDATYYIYAAPGDFTDGSSYLAGKTWYITGTNTSDTKPATAQWAFITADNYAKYLAENGSAANKATIVGAKGDATSLISNPTFENDDVTAWTGGIRKTGINTWRGTGADYENIDGCDATFSQTLKNMPKGTYKVVAAVRGAEGTSITASINGTVGTTIVNTEFKDNVQINTNGVLMPVTDHGFNTAKYALGWKWATATATLAEDGDLTISFESTGSGFCGIDDVHLYYMSDGENTYAMEYADLAGNGIDARNHAITCDLSTDNPNKVFVSTWNITTAAGETVNNNLVDNGYVGKLVLVDGYEFSTPRNFRAVASTLYRNIAEGDFATITCPFAINGGADGTFYQPASLTDGTLAFETATSEAGKAYLYKATSAVTAVTGAANAWVEAQPIDNGTGVTVKGTYTKTTAPRDSYVLSSTQLWLVNNEVSLNPFRAYFEVPTAVSAKLNVSFFDETTGISQIEKAVDNQYYNLQGVRISKPTKGLYILNGKKYVVK
jgi:hypothetical protein